MKTQDDPQHGSAFEQRLRRHYQSVYGPAPDPKLIWSQIVQDLDDQDALGTIDVHRRRDRRALDSELHTGEHANTGSQYPAQGAGSHLRAFVAVAATLLVIATSGAVFGLLAAQHKSPIGSTAPISTETPSATLPQGFVLSQMQMFSDRNGWAAGILDAGTPEGAGLLLHFDGFRWNTTYTLLHAAFYSISMISPTEGWVTGINNAPDKGGSITGSFILHYQHGRWVHETAPMAAMISLNMFTATSGWAVGARISNQGVGLPFHRQVAVYQNGTWIVSDEPCISCQVTFLSDGEGWAWGSSKDANDSDRLWHYRNGKWIAISFPGLDPNWWTLDMAFTSQTDGWAIEGVSFSPRILLHFNGLDWEQVPVPATVWPQDAGVGTAIVLMSATEFFIVNIKYNDTSAPQDVTLIHYNSGAWSTLSLPKNYLFSSPGNPRPTTITGISVISPNDLWVAGTDWTSGDLHASVIGHYHNGTWTIYQ